MTHTEKRGFHCVMSLVKVTAIGSRRCQEEGWVCAMGTEFWFPKMKIPWKEKWAWLDNIKMYLVQGVIVRSGGRRDGVCHELGVSVSQDENILEREVVVVRQYVNMLTALELDTRNG